MRYDPKKHHRRSVRLVDYDYTWAGAYFVTICAQRHICLFGDVAGDEMRPNEAGCMVQGVWDELANHYPGVETDAFVVMPNHVHGIIVLTDPSSGLAAGGVVGAGPRACPEMEEPQGVVGAGPCACPEMEQPQGVVGAGPRACPKMEQPQGVVGADPCACPPETGQPRGVAPTANGVRRLSLGDVVQRFKTATTRQYIDGVRCHGWLPFPGRLWQRNYYEHIIRNEESLNRIRRYIVNNPASWMQDRENPQAHTDCHGSTQRREDRHRESV